MIHGVGIIHNDIRPPNVAVAEDGRVMVIDFDQARDHKCPGEILCEELRDLRSELGLPPVREGPGTTPLYGGGHRLALY